MNRRRVIRIYLLWAKMTPPHKAYTDLKWPRFNRVKYLYVSFIVITNHEILLYKFKFEFLHSKSPWFHKRNMRNNYPMKHYAWRPIFTKPSRKIHVGAADKSNREYKGYISGHRNLFKVVFYRFTTCNTRKVNKLDMVA